MKDQNTRPLTRFQAKAQSCGICYGSIEQQGHLDSCKHSFCSKCIEKWSQIENTCPLCKQKFQRIENEWRRIHYKSQKITKRKCRNQRQPLRTSDKSQSDQFEEQSLWLELLIDYILQDILL